MSDEEQCESRNYLPIIKWRNGSVEWYIDGELHRRDGPAVVCSDGFKMWYWHGKLHRNDGPAVVYPDGTRQWCQNGEVHREDGPAVECSDGALEWWLNGKELPERALLKHQQLFLSHIVIAALLPLELPPYVLLSILQFAYPFVRALDERQLVCFLQGARISALEIRGYEKNESVWADNRLLMEKSLLVEKQ